ncbi:MAG: hypothetical protein J6Y30_02915 [Treponema sp.]|nr:hypothetical protein [Treponema sp.]
MFILIFIVCLELSFACKDASRLSNFKKQQPTKKETLRYLGFGLLRVALFLLAAALVSLALTPTLYFYYWVGRNKELIEAVRPSLNSNYSLTLIEYFLLFLFPVSVILAAILVIKKIRIALSLVFPMIAIFGFTSFLMLADNDLIYYKNPLADTKVSESFKPLNLPLLKEGMTKEEVLNLLGEPLSQSESCFYYTEENGKGWYDYFILEVHFENDAVVKIRKDWGYED